MRFLNTEFFCAPLASPCKKMEWRFGEVSAKQCVCHTVERSSRNDSYCLVARSCPIPLQPLLLAC